jgi:hypothetical protein
MFNRVRDIYGALGVMLFLIALYLVLENGANASKVIASVGGTTSQVFRTLQGR